MKVEVLIHVNAAIKNNGFENGKKVNAYITVRIPLGNMFG